MRNKRIPLSPTAEVYKILQELAKEDDRELAAYVLLLVLKNPLVKEKLAEKK